jgi:hypothetical protein
VSGADEEEAEMIITTEQLKVIVGAGGSVIVDATTMTFSQMREVSVAAQSGNARITIKKVGALTAAQLTEIASLAPGLVWFDLTA